MFNASHLHSMGHPSVFSRAQHSFKNILNLHFRTFYGFSGAQYCFMRLNVFSEQKGMEAFEIENVERSSDGFEMALGKPIHRAKM